jgi:uncharacterized membrane protein YgcG
MHRGRYRFLVGLVLALACDGLPAPAFSQAPPSPEQLEKLVAPIALYPDALVAQILPASTNPVQVLEAARSVANGGRPTQEQASAWDPSVQALISYPTVLKMMSAKMDWMTSLGEAVAMQPSAVMAAIQTVRRKAQAAGNLRSNDKQVVVAQGDTIVIQPANPQVIYVPQYNPTLIYAPPPAYYAPYAPAAGLMSFGVGFAAGAATAYACDWHGSSGSVTVNNNYHYSSTNNYPSGSTAHYNSATGAYHGYDAKTGTYGAYNPETGKYATYNPSTGAYNKDGTTGTYNKSTSSEYHPDSGVHTGYDSKTGTYGAYNPQTGKYGTYNPSTGAYNKDGTTGTYDKPSSTSSSGYHPPSSSSSTYHPPSSSQVHQSTDDYRSAYHGGSGEDRSSWGSHSEGYGHEGGGDAFRGMGGGGWGAREASDRGARSFGGGGFGGGGFRGRR